MDLTTPDSLSLRQRFKQSKQILKNTSRASHPDWYKDSLGINLQLHIFVGSDAGAISFIRNTKEGSWAKGPNISAAMQETPSLIDEVIDGIYNEHLSKSSRPSLGVILYVADEFATAELGPDHQNPAETEELRRLIIENPSSILEDQSLSNESHSWRLFPYPGATGGNPFATAISLSRKHDKLLTYLREYGREKNFPIQTRAISAPLCTISALPWLLESTPENGFVTVLHYPRFTTLAFFNTHGDLILIRTLQHHGNMPFPPNTASAIKATATSLELTDPHVFILPMAGQPPMGLSGSISSIMQESQVIILSPTSSQLHIPTAPSATESSNELLGMTRPWKWSDLTAQAKVEASPSDTASEEKDSLIPNVTRPWKVQDMAAAAMLSQVRLEIVSTVNPPSSSDSPLATSHTFSTLVQEMWPIQDFLPTSLDEQRLFPKQLEIKLLKYSKFAVIGAVAAIVLFTGVSVFQIWKAKQDPAWGYIPGAAQYELSAFNKKLNTIQKQETMLTERSRVWSNMELLNTLFPETSKFKIDSSNYSANMDSKSGSRNAVPILRTWNIRGVASRETLKVLNELNTEDGIKSVFEKVHAATGDPSFVIAETRNLMIDIKVKNNQSPQKENPDLVLNFDITINQRIDAEDPLALPSN